MGESLNPTLLTRVSNVLRPDFTRTVRARRVAAGLLVALAALSALHDDPAATDVVVAAGDLGPGTSLQADQLRLEKRSATVLPEGALTAIPPIIGATVAGPVRRGEVLTDIRVIGSRLAGLSAGPDARMVPLRLADAAVADVIRPGDVVDILGSGTAAAGTAGPARPRPLAVGAVVVSVTPAATAPGGGNRVVLVALPAPAATALAGAALTQEVTVAIH